MFRVRILPLLKRLGFKQSKENPSIYVHQTGDYDARVFKVDDDTRAIDITKVVRDESGEFHHRENVLKGFALDFTSELSGFYLDWLRDMGREFGNQQVQNNYGYYFSLRDDRLIEDTYKAQP